MSTHTTNTVAIDIEELERFCRAAFLALGVPRDAAKIAARGLAFADERGISSHGVVNLARIYVARLRDGRIDARARPRVAADRGATAVIDGRRALGFVTAHRAMAEAIDRARSYGVGVVTVRDSTHCGSLAYYTHQALERGMVAIAMTNLGRQGVLRPPGGAVALIGTNVIAAAAPAGSRPHFSLDMSTAVASTGRMRTAMRNSEQLPPGWLVDDHGDDVQDPAAYFDGSAHLQFLGGAMNTGGYKGYGLALLVDVLCGLLSGADVGAHSEGVRLGGIDSDDGVGHFMLALDIGAFRDRDDFTGALNAMLEALTGCPTVDADHEVMYPGLKEARALSTWVSLDAELAGSLHGLAAELSVSPPSRRQESQR